MPSLLSRKAPLRQDPEFRLVRPLFPAEEDLRFPSCTARHCAGTPDKVRFTVRPRWIDAPSHDALRLTHYRHSRISQLEAKIAKLDNILSSQQTVSGGSTASPVSERGATRSPSITDCETAESSQTQPASGFTLDPFQLDLLSIETGDMLLDRFRGTLTPYFPFVIIPESSKVTELHREKPIVCLAVLFASSYDDGALQARISRLFEQMLATALLQGRIASLENLQGLLIYTAW